MRYNKYSLSKKGKNICPECGKKSFVLYIDNNTGNSLHSTVGKCDRLNNCDHRYTPKQYFKDNHTPFDSKKEYAPRQKPAPKPQPSFIDMELLKKSLSNYGQNQFAQWLAGVVGEEKAGEAIERYFVGTSKNGGTCFWQIDLQGKIRAGKIIVYGKDGHRRKDVKPPVQWVHSVLKLPNFNLSQCLFGEHLLRDTTKMVAIVESEKSAVIASCYLPDYIWLACGGSEGLNQDKCKCMEGRTVILFPDAGCFDKWSAKAKELSKTCTVSVSSLIEENATNEEIKAGFDIVDYLVRFSLSDSTKQKSNMNQTEIKHESNEHCPAYCSNNGILYIPTPPDGRLTYTVYPSVEAYNKRSELPKFAPVQSVDITGMEKVFINLNTLTI